MVTPHGRIDAVLLNIRRTVRQAARDRRHRLAGADQSRKGARVIAPFITRPYALVLAASSSPQSRSVPDAAPAALPR